MKVGMRKPSLKKSIKARTTGKVKRKVKKSLIPAYGKKGTGLVKDPKKAVYNKVYNKTSFSILDLFKPNKPTKKQNKPKTPSKDLVKQQMIRDYEIICDSLAIIDKTKNPDTFFSRLNLIEQKCRHLCELDKQVPFYSINKNRISVEDLYNDIVMNYQEAIHEFLVKYFISVLDKVETLKTAKARLRHYENFRLSLEPYYQYMSDENIDYVETKYNAYTRSERK